MRQFSFICPVLLAGVLVGGTAATALGDWVVLKDKRKFAGLVTDRGTEVDVKASDGAVRTFKREEIERVLESPRDVSREADRACDEALALFQKGGEAADAVARNELLKQAVAILEKAKNSLDHWREIFPEEVFGYLDTAMQRVVKNMKLCRERRIAEGTAGGAQGGADGGAGGSAGQGADLPVGKSLAELVADLKSPEGAVRRAAVLAIGAKREEKGLPDVVRLLREEKDEGVRAAAREILSKAPPMPVVRTFGEVLKPGDAPAPFQEDACAVLAKVGTADGVELVVGIALGGDLAARPAAVAALRAQRATAARKLSPRLSEADDASRRKAIDLLVDVGGHEAATALLPLLALPDELANRQEEASDALLRLKGHAVPTLIDGLLDESLRPKCHALLRAITHQNFLAGEVLKWRQWLDDHRAELLK